MSPADFVVPQTASELMAEAWAMEVEAAQRYDELADALEIHNNGKVAALFRKMAGYETAHAQRILIEMGWTQLPPPTLREYWVDAEAPETAPTDGVHYLMQPYHALELALAAEERAERFFAHVAEVASVESVRNAARTLQAEEHAHVDLVRERMRQVEQPDCDWAVDPDPPRYTD